MKLLFIFALIVCSALSDSVDDEFRAFKRTFHRTYRSLEEEATRREIFRTNQKIIREHNAKNLSWTLGTNQFSDWTTEEFQKIMLSPMELPVRNSTKEDRYSRVKRSSGQVRSDGKNWVTEGAVSAVKDQGRCGSCWAFAAVAVAESFKFLETGTLGLFSDQQVTSCDTRSSGCNGGWHHFGLQYLASAGITTEKSYPYTSGTTGSTGTCKDSSGTKDSFTISGYSTISGISGLMSQLDSSPVAVAVDASNWSSYSSGIFSNCGTSLNHAVLAVGYTSEYILVKNSWGTSWGESGYIRLAPGNTCGIANQAYIPR